MGLRTEVLNSKEQLIEYRRYFHMHPEVSMNEVNTIKVIQKELDRFGIENEYVKDAGVYAKIEGKNPGKQLAIRADMDALAVQDLKDVEYKSLNEGFCHACGHDGHTAVLLITAKLLYEKRDQLKGTIHLFFQQGEEYGKGARNFTDTGYMDNVDRVIGFHVSNNIDAPGIALTPGPQNASVDRFEIKVHGKGAHVSQPHMGVDALYIASQIVVALQSIVSRHTDPLDTVLVGVGKLRAGTQYNVIAPEAVIEGTTRAFSKVSRKRTNDMIRGIAENIAHMHGATISWFIDDCTPPLINDEDVCKELQEIAKPIIGEENILTNFEKTLAGDNFADFLDHAKGAYAFVGTRNKIVKGSTASQHHGSFDIDEESLLRACQLFYDYALWFLQA